MKSNHLLIINIFLLSLSCSGSNDFAEFVSFDTQFRIEESDLNQVDISTDLFIVREMVSTESNLFVLTKAADSIIKVFDHDLNYIGAFGNEGQGPEELLSPYQDGFRHFGGDRISVVDRRSIRTMTFDTDKNGFYKSKQTNSVKFPGELIPLWEGNYFKNSKVIGLNQTNENKQFVVYDYESNLIDFKFEYPPIPYTSKIENRSIDFYAKMKTSKDKKRIFLAYRKMPLIRIINLENDTSLYYKVEKQTMADYIVNEKGIPTLDPTFFYEDLDVSADYIFASYRKRLNKEDLTSQLLKSADLEMHVFDLEGKPVCKLILQDWMTNFAVLPKSNSLVFHHPERESVLYRYEIPLQTN